MHALIGKKKGNRKGASRESGKLLERERDVQFAPPPAAATT